MDRLRVLIVNYEAPYFPGPGDSTRVYCLTRELAKKHEITFLLPLAENQDIEKVRDLSKFCKVLLAEPVSTGTKPVLRRFAERVYWKINSMLPIAARVLDMFGPPIEIKALGKGEGRDAGFVFWEREWF